MNVVTLVGNVTRDIEVRKTSTNKSVARFTIAVNEGKDQTDFIDCVAWERNAENIAHWFSKGSKIGIVGKIRVNEFKTKEGQNAKDVCVWVDRWEFAGSKEKQEQMVEEAPERDDKLAGKNAILIDTEDLPFY